MTKPKAYVFRTVYDESFVLRSGNFEGPASNGAPVRCWLSLHARVCVVHCAALGLAILECTSWGNLPEGYETYTSWIPSPTRTVFEADWGGAVLVVREHVENWNAKVRAAVPEGFFLPREPDPVPREPS